MDIDRNLAIRLGLIVPHTDLHDQYCENAVGPSCSQPWRAAAPCLRLDAAGKFWAEHDVLESIQLDYNGRPPGAAATRIMYDAMVRS